MSKQVRVPDETHEDLDDIRRPGQTYGGAVTELVQLAKDEEGGEA